MDPVVALLGRLATALLFAGAVRHKLSDRVRFEAVLSDYQVLPRIAVHGGARAVVWAEGLVVAALLLPATAGAGALGAASLLALYSGAIALNLARGRREIACGCGGPADQTLGPELLARNVLLIAVALASALPPEPRPLVWFDAVTGVLGLGSLVLLWHAAGWLAAFPFPWLPLRRRMRS